MTIGEAKRRDVMNRLRSELGQSLEHDGASEEDIVFMALNAASAVVGAEHTVAICQTYARMAAEQKRLRVAQDQPAVSEKNALYEERARVAVALARAAQQLGHYTGFAVDPQEPDWPVLFIDLPTGQVSWHFAEEQRRSLAADIGLYDGEWDKHTTPEKYDRLDRWRSPLTVSQLAEFLYEEWDPIVVNDAAPRDEYETYAIGVYGILMDVSGGGQGFSEVVATVGEYLARERRETMCIPPDDEKDAKIAFAIVDMARRR